MGRLIALSVVFLTACGTSADVRIDRLIEDFRDPDPDRRDQAETELRELGPRADAALRAHLDDFDPEVASRCRRLLEARVSDAVWYETAAICGLDLQCDTYERLLETGSDMEKCHAGTWLRTLRRLATNRASQLRAARDPLNGQWDEVAGLHAFVRVCTIGGLEDDHREPDALQRTYAEACARTDNPTLLALALEVAGREGLDLELRWRSGTITPVLHFRRRAEIFSKHWQPWHRERFRP